MTDHKEMAAIAADRLAGRQPEDDDVPMENMVVEEGSHPRRCIAP